MALPVTVKQNDAKNLLTSIICRTLTYYLFVAFAAIFFPAAFGSRFTVAELALKGGDNGSNAPGGSSIAPMSELASFALLTIGAAIGIGLRFSKTGVGHEMNIRSRERFYC